MHPMLNTAIKAARRAGSIINRAGLDLERLQVSRKGPRDYVTEVDRGAESAIIEILSTAYPDHTFMAEESGILGHTAEGELAANEWVIDPLDGTGFNAYAVDPGAADPLVKALHELITHVSKQDARIAHLCQTIESMGSKVEGQAAKLDAQRLNKLIDE